MENWRGTGDWVWGFGGRGFKGFAGFLFGGEGGKKTREAEIFLILAGRGKRREREILSMFQFVAARNKIYFVSADVLSSQTVKHPA